MRISIYFCNFVPGVRHSDRAPLIHTDMSIINDGRAVCTKCGQDNIIKVYKSINVADSPDLKDKVKDGSLFLWECPHCGQVNLAKYDTLYHDPARKLMVWMVQDDNISETQMQAIANHTQAMGGYTLRLVDNMGGLMEKVLINDAGLDDVVIEMCKFVTKMEMAGKMEKSAAATFMGTPFHFYRIRGEGDDRLITFMYPSDGTMKGVDIGYNVYEDCTGIVERNPHIKPGSGFERIDASWLNSIMK